MRDRQCCKNAQVFDTTKGDTCTLKIILLYFYCTYCDKLPGEGSYDTVLISDLGGEDLGWLVWKESSEMELIL